MMSKRITKAMFFSLVAELHMGAIADCHEAHSISDNTHPRQKAALKERSCVKRDIAQRIEEMLK
jgi:hypothetical protein